ncbi:arylesterase [Martelella alba]|uniref:Arylesterase n=1 Tax=Martelella alba TaxID=2590451 RepID=A0A506TZL3_9HYPH|nr:arylesterase [Martelella alba]TPW27522.1 arylesterase [Martelella alba]
MQFKPLRLFAVVTAITISFVRPGLAADPLKLVVFGDSLVAGYELAAGEDYPAQLEKALNDAGYDVTVTNAGVSGDTTSGGLARIDWSIPDGTDGILLELGANDALRGIPPEKTKDNLEAMLSRLSERHIPVMLMGMMAPPNMGDAYAAVFNGIYEELATTRGLTLYPFFLDGVTTHADLQLSDGMHPNADGVKVMVEKSLPTVEAFLATIGGQ